MKLVNWTNQERVEQPDLAATSAFPMGEFRRVWRAMFGTEAPKHVIQGFAVEAAAVPDDTVTVRLDPGGGGDPALAIGGENLNTRVDQGQLIGGTDILGDFEGNATQTVSLGPEPAGTYYILLEFSYRDGASDNRVFWNEGASMEFLSAADTRLLPTWEIVVANAPAAPTDASLTLAEVTWNGATVSPGDILDLRDFLFEGPAQTAGVLPDFDRDPDRAANGVNAPVPVLRALGRQVQDLKGTNGWYERGSQPWGAGSGGIPADEPVSVGSLFDASFTVSTDPNGLADFNGVTGLQECLEHIRDAGIQGDVRVALYDTTDDYFQALLTPVDLGGVELTLEMVSGFVIIMVSHLLALSDPAITCNRFNGVKLVVTGLLGSGAQAGPFVDAGILALDNCDMYGALTGPFICRGASTGARLRRSRIWGKVVLADVYTDSNGLPMYGGVVDDCVFREEDGLNANGVLQLWTDGVSDSSAVSATDGADRLAVVNSWIYKMDARGGRFISVRDSRLGSAGLLETAFQAGPVGGVTLSGISGIKLDNILVQQNSAATDIAVEIDQVTHFSAKDIETLGWAADHNFLDVSQVANAVVDGITWLAFGPRAVGNSRLVRLQLCDGGTVNNARVQYEGGGSIFVGATDFRYVTVANSERVTVSNCYFIGGGSDVAEGLGDACVGVEVSNAPRTVVENCALLGFSGSDHSNTGNCGVALINSPRAVVSKCTFEDNFRHIGIQWTAGVIEGTRIENNSFGDIFPDGGNPKVGWTMPIPGAGTLIVGNTFSGGPGGVNYEFADNGGVHVGSNIASGTTNFNAAFGAWDPVILIMNPGIIFSP